MSLIYRNTSVFEHYGILFRSAYTLKWIQNSFNSLSYHTTTSLTNLMKKKKLLKIILTEDDGESFQGILKICKTIIEFTF